MFRQGDVLLVPVLSIPKAARQGQRDQGRIVLAYGESTGHAHAIAAPGVELLEFGPHRFLRVPTEGAELRHEEHGAIPIPPGEYRVVLQREYSPEADRPVSD